MEGRIKSIAEFRLILEDLTNISDEGKNWLARAIVNILIVDKQLAPEEKGFFKDAIMMVESEKVRSELIESIKNRETVELGELLSDRDYAGHFFLLSGNGNCRGWKDKNIRSKNAHFHLRKTRISV